MLTVCLRNYRFTSRHAVHGDASVLHVWYLSSQCIARLHSCGSGDVFAELVLRKEPQNHCSEWTIWNSTSNLAIIIQIELQCCWRSFEDIVRRCVLSVTRHILRRERDTILTATWGISSCSCVFYAPNRVIPTSNFLKLKLDYNEILSVLTIDHLSKCSILFCLYIWFLNFLCCLKLFFKM